ncbi:hypothetical protein RQ744_15950 [Roseomonas mucosa]|uniref:hypothetical protein n=1 Tax=Roseomonas mucosa TaxID=207340 RepID=UPI001EF6B834|nr:hypothetical protein [Roseomonas mucosa]MCG7352183.1 hypothetical protein [Roseomonas mucosa]MCG7357466.1 hypothetical protein [Roseomonas mucosa]MDT8295472.1 hypothetical protein [Roseomonas mucosa]
MPEPLTEHAIALSISESDDMAALGLAKEHLDDAMAEIARHLLALGARLLYGGDLRPGGFTEVLFELVARYRRDAGEADVRPGVTNFVAWPVHLGMTAEDIAALSGGLEGAAALVLLDLAGEPITMEQRRALATHGASEEEWAAGLSAMRRSVTGLCHGRVVLGGRVQGYKGRMPGVAEEALLALRESRPLYVLGGFGGCARDIAGCLGLCPGPRRRAWPGQDEFARAGQDLRNGLTLEENEALAGTPHVDQAMALILRGLLRLTQRP